MADTRLVLGGVTFSGWAIMGSPDEIKASRWSTYTANGKKRFAAMQAKLLRQKTS